MWLFKGREDDDSDFESDDYDSDEYETDDEELDSEEEDDPSVIDDKNKQVDDMPERAETEEDFSEEEIVQENGTQHDNAEGDSQSEEDESSIESQESDEEGSHHADNEQLDESKDESVDDLEESREESVDEDEEASDEEDDDEEEATSLAEKQALLSLASENDRVDILKAILTPEDRDALLNSSEGDSLPPLHVAISYGSTHATSCLLRMGANPAIRPETRDKRYAGMSAWELAFGAENESKSDEPTRTIKPVDMAPSKREGIRHAFTAEALRCIGSDEVERLQHLLDSGMPSSIDIGGKDLHGWSIEMGASKCKELTRPFAPEPREESQEEETSESETTQKEAPRPSAVVSHLDSDSLLSLDNRLEELESLSKALSSCLDNLAEEVSVCHGLLLLGGGASALASHVRSLKVLKERRETELEQWVLDWNDSQDELAYWLQENGGADGFDDDINMATNRDLDNNERKRSFTPPESEEDEESQRRQLKAQIAASENKVLKLRASIADLSEENARDLVEVEKRGLSGGIKLVRTLREELREVEFELTEAKSGTAACRACVNLIVSRLEADKKKGKLNGSSQRSVTESSVPSINGKGRVSSLFADEGPSESDKIASGDSEAIALRPPGNRGYLPIDLWDIILRIIGFGRVAVKKSVRDNTPSAMII